MEKASPLDIPEIRTLIAVWLCRADQVCCARVSWSWHATFSPFVWSKLDLSNSLQYKQEPSTELIVKNASHVRSLLLDFLHQHALLKLTSPVWRNIRTLNVRQNWAPNFQDSFQTEDEDRTESVAQCASNLCRLVDSNPSLQELSIVLYDSSTALTPLFWHTVQSRCLALASLDCQRFMLEDTSFGAFINIANRVGHLSFRSMTVAGTSYDDLSDVTSAQDKEGPPSLTQVSIAGRHPADVALLRLCCSSPNLTSLEWRTTMGNTSAVDEAEDSTIVNVFRSFSMPSLQELHLLDHTPDLELAIILDSLSQPLEKLMLRLSGFQALSLQALLRKPRLPPDRTADGRWSIEPRDVPHCSTLTALDLSCAPQVTSAMVQTILTSCPRLIEFKAPKLNGMDVARAHRQSGGQLTWACTGLRRLRVRLVTSELETSQEATDLPFLPSNSNRAVTSSHGVYDYDGQRALMVEIQRLTSLEELSLRPIDRTLSNGLSLKLCGGGSSPEYGLEALQGLGALRLLKLGPRNSEVTSLELEWLLDHLPNLWRIHGAFSPERESVAEREAILTKRARRDQVSQGEGVLVKDEVLIPVVWGRFVEGTRVRTSQLTRRSSTITN